MMARIIPAIVAAGCMLAARSQDVAGLWLGTLRLGPSELRLGLHIDRSEKGLTATLDSLDQGAAGIPVSSITQDGRSVRIEINALSGTFEGTLNAAGSEMSGTWQQAVSLPLTFTRTDKIPETDSQRPKK